MWAYQGAKRLGSDAIGPEHLLLGALQEEDGELAALVEKQLDAGSGAGAGRGPTALTVRGAAVIEQAAALAAPHGIITARWLLTALVRDPFGRESRLLQACGGRGQALGQKLREDAETSRAPRKELRLALQFGEDMTARAAAGDYDPVACRDGEIGRMMQILCRRQKSNPVLLGPAGVGKSALAEGLAQRIVQGRVPPALQGKRLISLQLAGMVAGTKYRGEFEERVRGLIQEVRTAGDVILFIDEVHNICGAGSAEGAIDGGNLLKPALARGGLQIIGATTGPEFKKYISRDSALSRRFQPVQVRETGPEETAHILRVLRPRYEKHHRVTIEEEALEAAVALSRYCLPGRADPDRTVDLLDEASARAAMARRTAVTAQTVEQVARILRDGRDVGEGLDSRLLALEEHLNRQVLGQQAAAGAVARAMIRRGAFPEERRPRAAFLFCGPSGVGKTSMAKALAEGLYPGQRALIRLDMSEYLEAHSVSRLIGSPPGYVGYGEGGQLTERVKEQPASVVLLDEVEKAHPDVLNLLLQVLEEGCLTDGTGSSVSFRETVVILTSNLGSGEGTRRPLGFDKGRQARGEQILTAVRKVIRPELLGRLDGVIAFSPLEEEHLVRLAGRALEELAAKCRGRGIFLSWQPQTEQLLAQGCGEGELGARRLRQLVEQWAEDPLAAAVLTGTAGKTVRLEARNGRVEPVWEAADAAAPERTVPCG